MRHLLKTENRKLKIPLKRLAILLLTLLVGGGFYLKYFTDSASAAWADENFAFRTALTITNSGSADGNKKVKFDIDTAALITAGKMQSTCADSRFTDANGKTLQYFLDSANGACNTNSTDYYVLVPTINAGSTIIYHYYGNPSAVAGTQASQFSQSTFSPTGTSAASEEKAPQPVAYWKFDEGMGTVVNDGTSNKNNGTLTNGPVWQSDDQCISGKCLYFDGTDDYVTVPSVPNPTNVSFSTWVRTGTNNISLFDRSIASGRTQYQIYITTSSTVRFGTDGSSVFKSCTSTNTVTDNQWHFLQGVNNGTNIIGYIDGKQVCSASSGGSIGTTTEPLDIGRAGISGSGTRFYTKGFMDEVKIYPYARSAAQVKADFNSRGGPLTGSVLGAASNNNMAALSNGLVGYWKMDEASWNGTANEMRDSSGNGKNGIAGCIGTSCTKATTTGIAKFGTAAGITDNGSTTAFVAVADAGSTDPLRMTSASDMTMSAWINLSNLSAPSSGQNFILSKYDFLGHVGYSLLVNSTGSIRFDINGDQNSKTTTTGLITAGSWYHIVGILRGGNTMEVYVNGVQAARFPITSTSISSYAGSFAIGTPSNNIGSTQYTANGSIDDARVYNRALSASDVSNLYNFAPGPVGYWKLDEKSGTSASDSSGNSNTGTWDGSGNHFTQGKVGEAGKFDGSSDYISAANSTSLDIKNQITMSAWVYKTSNAHAGGVIFGKWYQDTSTWSYSLYGSCTSGGGFRLRWSDATQTNIESCTSDVPLNQWVYYTATYDGTTMRMYINGIQVASSTVSKTIASTTNALWIGDEGYGNAFAGKIDDAKIYNYARTPKQIMEDMQGSHPAVAGARTGSMVGYWKMDEGTGTVAKDSSGKGNNGTLTNMATAPSTSTSGWSNSGKFNKALNFDGTDDYVNGGSIGPLTAFTVTGWFKQNGTGNQKWIGIDETADDTKLTWIGSGNTGPGANSTWDCGANLTSIENIQTTGSAWNYYVLMYDGVKVTCYRNGQLAGTSANTSFSYTNAKVHIGKRAWAATGYFNGQIDEVKIYNYALTADDIKKDYNRGASQQFGSTGTTAAGVNDNSSERAYCPPGDSTATCAPVGEWSFEDASAGSAQAADTSGNGNNATWNGTGKHYTQGKVGKGGIFNGTDDFTTVADSSVLDMSSITLEGWVKFTAVDGAYHTIIAKWQPGVKQQYVLQLNTNNKLGWWTGNASTGGGVLESNTTPVAGKWYHIVVTASGTNKSIYLNGALDASTSSGNALSGTSNIDFSIGSKKDGGGSYFEFFNGQIDQVKVYNYARSGAQVAWDYNRGAPVAWYKMDECQGTAIHDSSSNRLDGTLTVGASGSQTSAGSCTTSSTAWGNGVNGKVNNSINFDGSDDYVTIGTPLTLSGSYSVSTWVKASALDAANGKSIISMINVNHGYLMEVGDGSANKVRFLHRSPIGGGGGDSFYSNTILSTGTWYHIVQTRESSTRRMAIYINGVLDKAQTGLNGDFTSSLYPNFGYLGTSAARFWSGQIDDTRVYNYALTPQQIKDLYNGGSVRFAPSTGTP
jgi:hypothetical protein